MFRSPQDGDGECFFIKSGGQRRLSWERERLSRDLKEVRNEPCGWLESTFQAGGIAEAKAPHVQKFKVQQGGQCGRECMSKGRGVDTDVREVMEPDG